MAAIATLMTSMLFSMLFVATSNSFAQAHEETPVKASQQVHLKRTTLVINARPDAVWSSIAEARTQDPELQYGKVLTQTGLHCTTEQKFDVPMLGSATCTFAMTNSPPHRIDYQMTSSDVFTDLLGSWKLTPVAGGRTKLELSCYAGVKRAAPRFMIDSIVAQLIKKRIGFVRTLAEAKEVALAASEHSPARLSASSNKAAGHMD